MKIPKILANLLLLLFCTIYTVWRVLVNWELKAAFRVLDDMTQSHETEQHRISVGNLAEEEKICIQRSGSS